ncbi:MAG: hypothetical protein HY685_03670 [Chloroflexi bacterium]|nr:hypothetical protein [Chloroflexota bacterium]
MRTLSSTLLAAQKAASAEPWVTVELADRLGGVARLAWSRLYTGAEADSYHGGALAGDGALLRARLDPSTFNLLYQRVPSPGPSSSFSSWQDFGTVSAVSGMALATQGSAVLLFYVGGNQRDVQVRESTDYGATFGSPVFIFDPLLITKWLAADFSAGGTPCLFFTAESTLYWTKKSGGSWTTPTAWTNSVNVFHGIACRYIGGDWCLVVCGEDAGGAARAWTCIFGDGGAQAAGTWSPLREIIAASANSSVLYRTPGLAKPDILRALLVEKYTGPGAYKRSLASHGLPSSSFQSNQWREPLPLEISLEHGPALMADATYGWMTVPAGVWRAPLSPTTADLSADVLEVEAREGHDGGRARVAVDNSRGVYDVATAPAALRLGAEVSLSLGYRTSAGAEASQGPRFWIEGLERRVERGRSILVIEAVNGWGLLEGWRARRQRTWTAGTKTVYQVLEALLLSAGLEVAMVSGSSALQTLKPAFTVLPGEPLAEAVHRLLAQVPDALRFEGAKGEVVYPQASDPSVYSYGTDHLVLGASDEPHLGVANQVQVYGEGALGEAFRWDQVTAIGNRLVQVVDKNLTTASEVSDRASAELRRLAVLIRQGEATVPVNCGQQLYDLVSLTSPSLGWNGTLFRVMEMETTFHRSQRGAAYRQRLVLGGA